MFERLFGKRDATAPEAAVRTPAEIRELAFGLAKPAVHLVKAEMPSRSHLGGEPTVPAAPPAPTKNGKPLPLVAQLDLADIQAVCSCAWLPAGGALLFYYDWHEQNVWGFDPADAGSWAIVHVPDRAEPALFAACSPDASSSDADRIGAMSVGLGKIASVPSPDRSEVEALALGEEETDLWCEVSTSVHDGRPGHQALGFPDPIQADFMELECQLVSNGLYCGDAAVFNDARARNLKPGAADWRLLLQIDSDDDLGVMFGDGGKVYFFLRQQDAEARRFDRSWLIFQCH